MSRITLTRLNDAVHLKATNEDGAMSHLDGAPSIGGQNMGLRPMELLLAALGGCASMDVISILKKMQQPLAGYDVVVDAQREQNETPPNLFTKIHVHFILQGKGLDAQKVARAVELSMEKYCSVSKTLEKTATITYDFEIKE